MRHSSRILRTLLVLLFFGAPPAFAADMVLLVLDGNSYLANRVHGNLEKGLRERISVAAADDIATNEEHWQKKLQAAEIVVVDVMGRELQEFVSGTIDVKSRTVYALRGSTDDEGLKKEGYLFDREVAEYYQQISEENVTSMIRLIAHRHLDSAITYQPVQPVVQLGLYHPEAQEPFAEVDAYLSWQRQRGIFTENAPRIGLLFFSSYLTPGQQEPIDQLIRRLEADGFAVLPCFGRDEEAIERFLLDEQGVSRVDLLLAFSLKFYSALTPGLAKSLIKLDAPLISALSLYTNTVDEWRKSIVGVGPMEITWAMATPEISGLIEPTVLTAKERVTDPESGRVYSISQSVSENIERLLPRLHRWVALQRKPNSDKKLAILYYNHHQGKQNVGASYLNVFRSLESIMAALKGEGYDTAASSLSEEQIKEMILAGGRNIGSWAPGELEKLIAEGEVVLLDPAVYAGWFKNLPDDFRRRVIDQWGEPGDARVMGYQGKIVIPVIRRGNLVLLPEPARGWSDDPQKLYHDTTLYPHHQYLATYLWLQHGFGADAMVHLGTHATYEWTPGKQAGLSPSCSPEVLITDIPNIYPYIVDNIGEALQAKRRGRGVMISHLTPMVRRAGLYQEFDRMAELVDEYERAMQEGASTAEMKLNELLQLAGDTGILDEMKTQPHVDHDHHHSHPHLHDGQNRDDALVHQIGHYLDEIRSELIPYGMHTFGAEKPGEELDATAAEIHRQHQQESREQIGERLKASAVGEIRSLLSGLAGRYVQPGEGNDPIRNLAALPTGRNLYGFSPNRLPSREAWALGKRAAEQIISNHREQHGTSPEKVAVVLWAVELLRNEGVNEATILWLIGVRPKWLQSGRVAGLEVVPRRELRRPRIDVLINPSGLYRDIFPEKMLMLDEAVQLALDQTDLDNLLARNSRSLYDELTSKGLGEEDAREYSRLRIFTEESGSYGNGVSDMASGSALWDDADRIVDVMENRTGFAFSADRWGLPAKELLARQLAGVDTVVHSRSSNIMGLLDNDDMFQYLGGLAMAVKKESGKTPETFVTSQKERGKVEVEDLGFALAREIRSRYLNPRWITGMQAEDYAGANAMAKYIEYLWGWQVTTPDKVSRDQWQQSFEVYVQDKYNLEMQKFFDKASPWAYQGMTGRMLETIRKGYWQPAEDVRQKLAQEYAMSVITKGVACCEHTCNNPMLNQMVASLLSLPGVMSPELVEQFKIAIEKSAEKSLDDQVAERSDLLRELADAPGTDNASTEQSAAGSEKDSPPEDDQVKGFRMEKIKTNDDTTQVSSSGAKWFAGAFVLAIIGLGMYGARRSKER